MEKDIFPDLKSLVTELGKAEHDLLVFNKSSVDSGDANWLKDQEKYIKKLKETILELLKNYGK